jgi:hypothetical protein
VSFTISPPIRIAAIAGLLLVVALGGATMMLGRSHSPAATPTVVRTTAKTPATHRSASPAKAGTATHKAVAKATTHKTAATKQNTHTAAAKPATTAKAAAKTTAKHAAAKHAAAKRGNLVDATLPRPLQWQLAQHKIVVVSVYDPRANVDAISVAEAHAGAVDAGAGFLLVNVLDNSLAGLLTAVLPGGGLLPDPGVLIYRAPGTLALRIDGFADRDAIAQAAANALAGQSGPTTAPVTAPLATP